MTQISRAQPSQQYFVRTALLYYALFCCFLPAIAVYLFLGVLSILRPSHHSIEEATCMAWGTVIEACVIWSTACLWKYRRRSAIDLEDEGVRTLIYGYAEVFVPWTVIDPVRKTKRRSGRLWVYVRDSNAILDQLAPATRWLARASMLFDKTPVVVSSYVVNVPLQALQRHIEAHIET